MYRRCMSSGVSRVRWHGVRRRLEQNCIKRAVGGFREIVRGRGGYWFSEIARGRFGRE